MTEDVHRPDIPDRLWKLLQKKSGQSNPSNYVRNVLWEHVTEERLEAPQVTQVTQPLSPAVKQPLHVAVDWDKYGMGFDIEDPDFTDVILPWFIEIKGGEKEAEARIIEKMNEPNPITKPRKWVCDLYYKNKRRNAG